MKRYLPAIALTLFALSVAAQADTITIGISDGIIISRDEFNMPAGLGASYQANFGVGEPIVTVNYTVGNEVAIGRGNGNISARYNDTMSGSDNTSAILGGSITAAAVRPDGHVAFGNAAGAVFMQDRTNYGAAAPGYTGGFNGTPIFATPIVGLGSFSNGDLAIGGANGTIWIRDKNDVSAVSSLVGGDSEPIFGLTLNDLVVTPSGNFVMAFNNGLLVTRDPGNIAADVSSANFGGADAPTSLAVFPNGDIVVGTSLGGVSIRNESNLPAVIGPSATFTGGGVDITALTVTSNGNVGIGTADGQVFMVDGSNITVPISGAVNFGAAVVINDLAAIPEPGSIALILIGGGLLATARRFRATA